MNTRERIKFVIKELRKRREFKSQKEIAAHMGYHPGSFSRALNSDPIPFEFEDAFFKAFPRSKYLSNETTTNEISEPQAEYRVSPEEPLPEWRKDIIIKENEIYINSFGIKFIPIPGGKYLMVTPLLNYAAQGSFLNNYQDVEYITNYPETEAIVVDKPLQGNYVSFRVTNESMVCDNPVKAILPDDVALGRELQRVHWTSKLKIAEFPEWIIYTTKHQNPILKNITAQNLDKGTITCHSYNPAVEDFELSLDDVRALFYVIDIRRSRNNKFYY